jgi:hypothetical protein
MSTRPQRIEVIMPGERRRRWSVGAEAIHRSGEPCIKRLDHRDRAQARHRHWQLYGRRHQLLVNRPVEAGTFARVALVDEARRLDGPVGVPSRGPSRLIEIILPDGPSVRVDAQMRGQALRPVLAVLRG